MATDNHSKAPPRKRKHASAPPELIEAEASLPPGASIDDIRDQMARTIDASWKNGPKTQEAALLLAKCLYICDPNITSIGNLAEEPMFRGLVKLERLESQAKTENWRGLRFNLWERWRRDFEDRVGENVMGQRIDVLCQIRPLKNLILSKLVIDHPFVQDIFAASPDDLPGMEEAIDRVPSSKKSTDVCGKCQKPKKEHDPFHGVRGDGLLRAWTELIKTESEVISFAALDAPKVATPETNKVPQMPAAMKDFKLSREQTKEILGIVNASNKMVDGPGKINKEPPKGGSDGS